jgi:NAD(P)H-hydrate epimerase
VLGAAVKADLTVTFIGAKQGLFTGEGLEYTGEVAFDALATPPALRLRETPSARLLPPLQRGLPPRPRHAHKGLYGHALVVGGDRGYGGAVRMAAEAAARVGAGLVSAATHPEHAAFLALARPELMGHGVAMPADLAPLLERATAIALGPGLGRSAWSRALFAMVCHGPGPLLVDADGLNLLAESPQQREDWILTPHPGEAGRLLGVASAEIQRDRFAAARELQARYGGVVVLKGSGTLIAGPDAVPALCIAGNPGMASGGMGDVLTGLIGGLIAQGTEPGAAAALGVFLHGLAGDRLRPRFGDAGLLATDLLPELPAARHFLAGC